MGGGRSAARVLLVLGLCTFACGRIDDDFAFDNSDEFQVELTANHSEIAKNGLQRLWGVPDTSAYVGHLFRMEIPNEAFSGEVVAYKVRSEDSGRTPNWLAVDSKHGLISGVPLHQDLGPHHLLVTAHGRTRGLSAKDTFTVQVKRSDDKPQSRYGSCSRNSPRLVLAILIDSSFYKIAPRQRIRALMELSTFMALDGEEFWIEPFKSEGRALKAVMSGPGTTQRRRSDSTTAIYLNVGCGDKLWTRHKVLVAGIREQARDGTLSHLLRLPVLGWRLLSLTAPPRRKRQSPPEEGSGTYDSYDSYDGEEEPGDYSGDDEDEDDENYDIGSVSDLGHDVKITPYSETAQASNINSTSVEPPEPAERAEPTEQEPVYARAGLVDFPHSPVDIYPVTDPTSVATEPDLFQPTVIIRESNEVPAVPTDVTTPTSATTAPPPPPSPSLASITPPPVTPLQTTISLASTTANTTSITTSNTTTPAPEITTAEVTDQDLLTTTEHTSTIVGRTTETMTFAVPTPANQPPILKHHMKKLGIIAGKAFRYIIPADLFVDAEDGSNLTFTMYDSDNVPLAKDSWIQFIPTNREVYGLPLESHVSRWNFVVEAQDSEGLSARGPLDITVQQYKSSRTINHQFVLTFKLLTKYDRPVDWQVRALEGIVGLFRDTDMDHLTVLNATQSGDWAQFVWTNDTLPKDAACPIDDINRLMKIMESDSKPGTPSATLTLDMKPDLEVTSVEWRGTGACAPVPSPVPSAPAAAAPVPRPQDTYPPVMRNPVDHITATVGHLLVYKVPEDTFFDPEDGGTRALSLSLRYSDRSPLPPGHWLQFDARNQEFYGLPAPGDEGHTDYQLIAEDSSKQTAYDSLIVEVAKAPVIHPTVEFQMTTDPYPGLAYSARDKRRVVEKLAALFDQHSTDSIRVHSITDNPTTIVWYNTSLPMDRCPKAEIEELRKMIIVDDRGSTGGALKENVDQVFDKDLKVMSIRLIPLGLCADQNTKVPKTVTPVLAGAGNVANSKGEENDAGYTEYLVTFVIPAVVIVCMILVAGIIACVLYRRRRTGKMSVGDEEERQAFRSKGIPVIFNDELDDRPDTEPVHKSPIIMREEKPPLLPPAPDYRSSAVEDAPYRPPPPFAASRTPPRPKATPTYRKPPPYVPP